MSPQTRHQRSGAAGVRPVPGCPACGECRLPEEIAASLHVCPGCGHHFRIDAKTRLAQLLDESGFEEWDRELRPRDPLQFVDVVPYSRRTIEAHTRTGLHDAVITGTGRLDGHTVGLAVMDFGYIGGSMGEVVGERVARAMERSAARAMPFIAVTSSGGARMQEGLLSLMQMAKTSIARTRLAEVPVVYISVLANPTVGGVMASFASSADVILAEPGATIGFAGARVISQATHEEIPPGFQTSEFMLEHGFIDKVVDRRELTHALSRLLELYPEVATVVRTQAERMEA